MILTKKQNNNQEKTKRNITINRVDTMEKIMQCEVYSRVVGYYRPVQNWNKGKQQEFREREEFVINNANNGGCGCS